MTPDQVTEMLARLKASPTEQVVEIHQRLKAHAKELKDAYEVKAAPVEERQALVAAALLDHLNSAGATSIKTAHGTVYAYNQKTATIVDAEALWEWAKTNNAPDVYQKRVNLSGVEGHNEADPENPVVGLHMETIKSARVRAK